MSDAVKDSMAQFVHLQAQVCWLADRLSEARILVGHDECSRCRRMAFQTCGQCWREKAARAVREERHSK